MLLPVCVFVLVFETETVCASFLFFCLKSNIELCRSKYKCISLLLLRNRKTITVLKKNIQRSTGESLLASLFTICFISIQI